MTFKVLTCHQEDKGKKLHSNSTLTAKKLKQLIPELADVKVRTIQNICKAKLGLPSRKMVKKPLLTDSMKLQRLEFARQYGKRGVEEWKKVMFSDESHFELRFGSRSWRCRRPVGLDRHTMRFTMKTVKHPPKVMVWGCFRCKGCGGLEFLIQGEMMNGVRYRQLLDEKL
jgi:hypothetical protein